MALALHTGQAFAQSCRTWDPLGLWFTGLITPDSRGTVSLCVSSSGSSWSCALASGGATLCGGGTPPAGKLYAAAAWPATILEQRELAAGISIQVRSRLEASFAAPSVEGAPFAVGLESSPGIVAISRARRIAAGKPVP